MKGRIVSALALCLAILPPLTGCGGGAAAPTVASVEVTPDPAQMQVAGSMQLTATARDASGNIVSIPPANFTWEMASGASFASVNSSGLVSGLAEGTATVRATEGRSALAGEAQMHVTPGPVVGRIAFVSNRDGNDEIYVMNPDGCNQTRLTNNPGEDRSPSWSPDGSKIAVEAYEVYSTEADIFVMNSDGTDRREVHECGYYPSWSPVGNKIAFQSPRTETEYIFLVYDPWGYPLYYTLTHHRNGILAVNSDGTDETWLTRNRADDGAPSWSPDGSKIAFYSNRDGNWEVYIMNADGTNQTNLTNNSVQDGHLWASAGGPSWSPDGSKIAFVSYRDGNWEVYAMNWDGTNQTNLSNSPAEDMYPSWSPDGSKIAFQSIRDANLNIYVMNSDGTNQTRLTNNRAVDRSPSWSPLT